jgi:hypothetical protein
LGDSVNTTSKVGHTWGFKNMTAMSCSIRFAKHDMGVNLRPVIFESDITD